MRLEGQTALVTGSVVRVGRAIAMELATRGANVIVHSLDDAPAAEATAQEVERLGVRSMVVLGDQRDAAQVLAACDAAWRGFGSIDILVNNASSWDEAEFDACTPEDFEASIEVNLRGPWLWAHDLGRRMKARGSGAIVMIGDASSRRPTPSHIPYSIAKAGLRTMTVGLAKALAPEVRVTAVEPGPVLFPDDFPAEERSAVLDAMLTRKLVAPEEIARAVCFLVGCDSATASVLTIDGGYRYGV